MSLKKVTLQIYSPDTTPPQHPPPPNNVETYTKSEPRGINRFSISL